MEQRGRRSNPELQKREGRRKNRQRNGANNPPKTTRTKPKKEGTNRKEVWRGVAGRCGVGQRSRRSNPESQKEEEKRKNCKGMEQTIRRRRTNSVATKDHTEATKGTQQPKSTLKEKTAKVWGTTTTTNNSVTGFCDNNKQQTNHTGSQPLKANRQLPVGNWSP